MTKKTREMLESIVVVADWFLTVKVWLECLLHSLD
jgi:hypothetical protein